MRFLIPIATLLLAACSTEEVSAPDVAAALPTGTYSGNGRDALCVTAVAGGQRAGFVVYGKGDENCSARGTIAQQGLTWTLTPQGDAECRIALSLNDNRIAPGPGTPTCGYYCGPGVTFAGTSFGRDTNTRTVTDFAGDPLC